LPTGCCSFSTTRAEGPQWYWGEEAPFWNAPAALTAEYVTRLFEDPVPALDDFTDAEVNMRLGYIITPALAGPRFESLCAHQAFQRVTGKIALIDPAQIGAG
jgi:hypothetical protein